MTLKIKTNTLNSIISDFTYQKDGDHYEKKYGDMISSTFPNSESFWKSFITPMTNRVDYDIIRVEEKIRARKAISTDLIDISIIHYSVFLNLVYAENCLITKHLSYFENFYTHLGSICDLAEELITQIYFITLECESKETEILQRLSKTKYIELAKEWYDNHYTSAYAHYLSKGKTAPFKIIGRTNILDEYFGSCQKWKNYSKLALQIRTYRNVIVHNTQIGSHITAEGNLVPKKNKIADYKKWYKVFDVKTDKLSKDFIERNTQMQQDIDDLKTTLNELWIKPIEHFNKLLYIEQNPSLLKKYDIEIIENGSV